MTIVWIYFVTFVRLSFNKSIKNLTIRSLLQQKKSGPTKSGSKLLSQNGRHLFAVGPPLKIVSVLQYTEMIFFILAKKNSGSGQINVPGSNIAPDMLALWDVRGWKKQTKNVYCFLIIFILALFLYPVAAPELFCLRWYVINRRKIETLYFAEKLL